MLLLVHCPIIGMPEIPDVVGHIHSAVLACYGGCTLIMEKGMCLKNKQALPSLERKQTLLDHVAGKNPHYESSVSI